MTNSRRHLHAAINLSCEAAHRDREAMYRKALEQMNERISSTFAFLRRSHGQRKAWATRRAK